MKPSALVLGNGPAGILLALGLSRRNWEVTLIGRQVSEAEDSPLICPRVTTDYLERVLPGSMKELIRAGARLIGHQEMLQEKFPGAQASAKNSAFLFLSRKLLLTFLNSELSKSPVKRMDTSVTALEARDGVVRGVETQGGSYTADFIFDCTGSPASRRTWVKALGLPADNLASLGRREYIFVRFFEAKYPTFLRLRSGENFRGGIYPLEGNRFAINVAVPETSSPSADEIDELARKLMDFVGGTEELKEAKPLGSWLRKGPVSNFSSDYYVSGNGRIPGLYPLGDSVLSSNPIYGRGISLSVLQMSPLLDLIDSGQSVNHSAVGTALAKGILNAEKKWKEVARESDLLPFQLIRKYYLFLLEREPKAYNLFLEFYQLQLTPVRLLTGLLLTPLSLKLWIPALLALAACGAFFLR